jgi:hypothetical protein
MADRNINQRCTLVTGLFNLHRETWRPPYHRAWSYYLRHFKKTLSLLCNMVVYVEPETVDFVERVRSKSDPGLKQTALRVVTKEALPMYRHHARIAAILSDPTFRNGLPKSLRPETYVPMYCVVILSKTLLLSKVCQQNPFDTKYFMWVDAGICREQFPNRLRHGYYPADDKLRLLDDNRVHLVCRSIPCPGDACIVTFFRSGVNRFAAGWFAGTAPPLIRFNDYCNTIVEGALSEAVIDSEQSVFTVCYLRYPELFHLHHGDWYDGFLHFSEPALGSYYRATQIAKGTNISSYVKDP